MGVVEIRYFELVLGNSKLNTVESGYNICIKSDHEPTEEEVREFCKEDMELYNVDVIADIIEIERDEAYAYYGDLEDKPILTESKKQVYKIPVSYEVYGFVYIEADDLEDACRIAEEDDRIPLPDEADYIDGTWKVDWEVASMWN